MLTVTYIIEMIVTSLSHRAGSRAARRLAKQSGETPSSREYCKVGREVVGEIGADGTAELGGDVRIAVADLRRHLLGIGASGSGKTSLATTLIDYLIDQRYTLVAVCPRGDLVDRIMARLAARDDPSTIDRVVCIDLRKDWAVYPFNPLGGPGDPHSRAFGCLGAIKSRSLNWGVLIEDVLRSCFVALAETGWSIAEVEPLLCNERFRDEVIKGVTDIYARSFLERYSAMEPSAQTAWAAPALNKLSPLLAMPALLRALSCRETLPIRGIIDSPGQILLIALDVTRLHEAGHLYGSLIASSVIQAALSRADIPESERNQTFILADEFENIASSQWLEAICEGRRFALSSFVLHQTLSQVDTEMSDLVLGNCRTQFYFQTSARDSSKLAQEVGGDGKNVRNNLTKLPTGFAYLVERSKPLRLLKINYTPDPPAKSEVIDRMYAASARRYGRPAAEVDRELEERRSAFSEEHIPGDDLKNHDQPKSPDTEVRPVRHRKRPSRGSHAS